MEHTGAIPQERPSYPQHYPRLRNSLCLRARYGPRFCASCRDACPHGAVTFPHEDALPTVERLLCTGCGECAAICPAEAWYPTLPPAPPRVAVDTDVGCRADHIPEADAVPSAVEFSCRRAAPPFYAPPAQRSSEPDDEPVRMTIPCVLGLSGGDVAIWQRGPRTTVRLRIGDCSSCPDCGKNPRGRRPFLLADLLPDVQVLVDPGLPNETFPAALSPVWAQARMSRKRLLGSIGAAVAGALLGRLLPTAVDDQALVEPNPPLLSTRPWFVAAVRRTDSLPATEARLVGLGSLTTTEEDCDGCGLCARSCPTDALALGATDLELRPEHCVGCGVCVARCPHGLLAQADNVDLAAIDRTVILTPLPARHCPCGAPALLLTLPERPRCQSCTRAEALLDDLAAPTRG